MVLGETSPLASTSPCRAGARALLVWTRCCGVERIRKCSNAACIGDGFSISYYTLRSLVGFSLFLARGYGNLSCVRLPRDLADSKRRRTVSTRGGRTEDAGPCLANLSLHPISPHHAGPRCPHGARSRRTRTRKTCRALCPNKQDGTHRRARGRYRA